MNTEARQVQEWANKLAEATSECVDEEVQQCLNDVGSDEFYRIAEYIVEPRGINDNYGEWMEEDPENWAGFITQICGPNWGAVAKAVNVYGY